MALILIKENSTPTYVALSTDIVDSKIPGASIVGATVLTTDNGEWYIVKSDLSLGEYKLPFSIEGDITIGDVNQGAASLTEKWLVKPDYPEDMAKFNFHNGFYGAVTVDEQHYKIHQGQMWQVSYYQSGLSSSDVINFGISTGNKEVHISTAFAVSGNATYESFKSVDFSSGTAITPFNHKFSVSTPPECSFVLNPTVSNAGQLIRKLFIPGGESKGAGASTSLGKEFILSPNSKYIIKYTNINGNSSIMNFVADFYEEE